MLYRNILFPSFPKNRQSRGGGGHIDRQEKGRLTGNRKVERERGKRQEIKSEKGREADR